MAVWHIYVCPVIRIIGTNILVPNTNKTKELVVDFKRKKMDIQPLIIQEYVEGASYFQFLGVYKGDLAWSMNTKHITQRTHQRLYFLKKLVPAGLHPVCCTA